MSTLNEIMEENCETLIDETNKKDVKNARKWRFVWHNLIFFSVENALSVYGIYLAITQAMWSTIIFAYVLSTLSNVGVTAGAHRLWSHKAYKAKLPLKILNLLMFTMAYQGSVHQWVRDHRVHHKYSDSDADPHNASRGFFFSHIGWLLVKKHPDVRSKGSSVDTSDIKNDPLLRIQHKYYFVWVILFSIAIPLYIPLLWGEDFWTSFIIAVVLRHAYALHMIFLVNSAAHIWGYKPYDKDILPAENKTVSFLATGEGFHNYHHTFPWDYRTAELGGYLFNTSWFFIDVMAKIGWAYDLKTVSEELIEKRAMRTGDGSHPVWGWDDKDLSTECKQSAKILY